MRLFGHGGGERRDAADGEPPAEPEGEPAEATTPAAVAAPEPTIDTPAPAETEPATGSSGGDRAADAAAEIRAAAEAASGRRPEGHGSSKDASPSDGGTEPGPPTAPPGPVGKGQAEAPAASRDPDLRLARIHLRTGAFALARAELEMLAGQERLDTPAILDLAEVRWRSGDLPGAGDAAGSYLNAGGDEALGFVIAAEAAAAADRPAEARRLAGRALERSETSLDILFAGISRSMIWPHDTWAEPAGAFFTRPDSSGRGARTERAAAGREATADQPAATTPSIGTPLEAPEPAQRGLWESPSPELVPIDADSEVARAAAALAAGDDALAALHLGVALRLAPTSAGAVVQAIGSRREPLLELIRGDALRLLGYEWDARRAYFSVAAGLRAASEVEREVPVPYEFDESPGRG